MIRRFTKKKLTKRAVRRSVLIIVIKLLINAFSVQACALTEADSAWSVLEAGLKDKHSGQRVAAAKVLGLIPNDAHAVELAEGALKDGNSAVRAAAATSLGQMHAMDSDSTLKAALDDKSLAVVLAAAHALHELNDPACYDLYYAVYTGQRKNNTSMIAQQMQVLHDPKQLAMMGFNEGIGYVPFAGIPWGAVQTIMKDRKSGAAAKAALISALTTDPDARTGKLLLTVSQNKNWVLRIAALQAIAKRGDPSLLPETEARLSDPKREVRYEAAAAVIHLRDVARAQAASETKIAQTVMPQETQHPELTRISIQTNDESPF